MFHSQVFLEDQLIDWVTVGDGVQRKLLGYDEKAMMVKIIFQKGSIGYMHKHIHIQVSYIESGSFKVTIGEENKILNKGDGYFIPTNIEHGVVCLEEGCILDVFSPMREDFLK